MFLMNRCSFLSIALIAISKIRRSSSAGSLGDLVDMETGQGGPRLNITESAFGGSCISSAKKRHQCITSQHTVVIAGGSARSETCPVPRLTLPPTSPRPKCWTCNHPENRSGIGFPPSNVGCILLWHDQVVRLGAWSKSLAAHIEDQQAGSSYSCTYLSGEVFLRAQCSPAVPWNRLAYPDTA